MLRSNLWMEANPYLIDDDLDDLYRYLLTLSPLKLYFDFQWLSEVKLVMGGPLQEKGLCIYKGGLIGPNEIGRINIRPRVISQCLSGGGSRNIDRLVNSLLDGSTKLAINSGSELNEIHISIIEKALNDLMDGNLIKIPDHTNDLVLSTNLRDLIRKIPNNPQFLTPPVKKNVLIEAYPGGILDKKVWSNSKITINLEKIFISCPRGSAPWKNSFEELKLILSHEYGHHYTMSYIFYRTRVLDWLDGINLDSYYKLRGVDGMGFSYLNMYYWKDGRELIASDFAYLFSNVKLEFPSQFGITPPSTAIGDYIIDLADI